MWILLSIINYFFAHKADVNFNKNRVASIFFLFVIVILNTIILGLRDFGVGTDSAAYVKPYFYFAASLHNIGDFLHESYYDRGYIFLAWISTLLSEDPQALLVITELFIISILMIGIYRYKRILNCNISWFMIFFVLLYQFETINLMRQFCAMSVLVYGFSYYLEKKYFKYFICQTLAYYFHSSSVIFIIVPFILYVSDKDIKIKISAAIAIITFFCLLIGFYITFLKSIADTNIINETYFTRYGENSVFANDGQHGVMGQLKDTAILMLQLTIVFFAYKNKKIGQNITYILVMLMISTYLLSSMRMVSIYLFRLGYYVGLISIIYFSIILKTVSLKKPILIYCTILLLTAEIMSAYRYYGYSPTGTIDNIYRSQILSL